MIAEVVLHEFVGLLISIISKVVETTKGISLTNILLNRQKKKE
jgi:hypothetical protein